MEPRASASGLPSIVPKAAHVNESDEPLTTPSVGTETVPIPAGGTRVPNPSRGYRIGPFIFVPEWTAAPEGETDPWAHRKGEPRLITLAWTIYLLLASGLTLFITRGAGLIRPVQYQSSSRRLFMLMVLGACVLWPMVRLSQAAHDPRERRVGLSILLDLIGLGFPAVAVLLPLPILTGWGWPVMLAVWSAVCGWALIALAIAAWGVGTTEGTNSTAARRLIATAVVLLLTLATPVAHAWLASTGSPVPTLQEGWWWAASPVTHILRLTTPPSGLAAHPTPEDWRTLVGVWAVGGLLALWVSSAMRR
jgi:hypothetical protein